jgi:hypothetical protein
MTDDIPLAVIERVGVFPDSIEFSGAGPPAYAILLKLLEVTLKVCHP